MDKLNNLANESIEEIKRAGIRPSLEIFSYEFNGRAKKRLGCCKKTYQGGTLGFKIEISNRLMTSEEKKIKEVLIHEILHTCKGCFDHGQRWKHYARIMNKVYGYNISRTADAGAVEDEYKYKIICQRCGIVSYRIRKTKVIDQPENYRCSKCGGRLTVKKYEEKLSI